MRAAVNWANLSTNANAANTGSAANTVVFDPTVFASPQTITLSLGTISLTNTSTAEVISDAPVNNVTISGGNNSGVFSVAGGVTAAISDVRIIDGSTLANGGAIDNSGNLTLTEMTLTGNSAANGGALANESGGSLILSDVTLNNNSATTTGGAIDEEAGGSLTATNVTIANNTASTGGGIGSTGAVTLINVTVAYNSATGAQAGGGLFVGPLGLDTIYNTIVASNTTATASQASDIVATGGGSMSSLSSFNLIGKGGGGGLVNGINNNLVGITAGLASGLAANGGPTATIAILAGSAAIDAGSTVISGPTIPITDQRGALRGTAGLDAGANPDIGAFEASSSYLVTTTTLGPDVGTITAAVAWANINVNVNPANPGNAPNTIVFSSSTFATPQTISLTSPLDFTNVATPEAIDGSSASGVTISGNNLVGVLNVASGVTMTVTGVTISQGSATDGAGIDNFGSLTVSGSTLAQNHATKGGAIDNEAGGTLVILNSTFAHNTATMGGGVYNSATAKNATITDSTFADNSATDGSAIFSAGPLTIVNATIASNVAMASGGGALDVSAGTAALYNTVVASNTFGTGVGAPASDIAGSVSGSSSFNLIGTGGSGGLSNGVNNNQVGVSNPLLGALASNGGPTQTIALLSSSPAIGGGSSTIGSITIPLTDQRGSLRIPVGTKIDVGAYAASGVYMVTSTADTLVVGTLRSAVLWSDLSPSSTPQGNTIIFDTNGVFATPQTITLSPSLGKLNLTNTAAPLSIVGPGANQLTISGGDAVGVFAIASNVTVTMTGMTISAGSAGTGGGAVNSQGNLTVANDVFSGNAAVLYGGAIYNNGGTLSVSNAMFAGNAASFGLGGAIDNAGLLIVANSTFTGGAAWQGGAIDNKAGVLSVTNSTFTNNSGTEGGAIFNNAIASIYGTTISNDVTTFNGGGIANDLAGTMTVVNSTIANNNAAQNGGGINTVGILTVINTTIAYNSVNAGGAGGWDLLHDRDSDSG